MSEALDRTVPELKAKSDLIVLFVELEAGRVASLLRGRSGLDFVVAGQGQDFLTEPRIIEGVPLIAIGNQGKYLAELRITRRERAAGDRPVRPLARRELPRGPELSHFAESTLDTVNELSRRETAQDSTLLEHSALRGSAGLPELPRRAFRTWQASKHAHAMETLANLKRDYTVACVTCHVTGYGADAGGFTNPAAAAALLNVQCEACHGPGQAHLEDPASPYGAVNASPAGAAIRRPRTPPSISTPAGR
jgi:hypothetical protein